MKALKSLCIFTIVLILLLLTFEITKAQLGETKEFIQKTITPELTSVFDSVITHQESQEEILVYNFENNICTDITIISTLKNSPMYNRLMKELYTCCSTGSGIYFNKDYITYKFFISDENFKKTLKN